MQFIFCSSRKARQKRATSRSRGPWPVLEVKGDLSEPAYPVRIRSSSENMRYVFDSYPLWLKLSVLFRRNSS